jgi:hemoglobin
MSNYYEQFGGNEFFNKLVDDFYEGVATDPILRPMYPDEDLAPAKRRLLMFLEQYWGGPTTYSDERGHPRLRMRHAPYPIGFAARDAWLTHMKNALDKQSLSSELKETLWSYLSTAADSMVNTRDDNVI